MHIIFVLIIFMALVLSLEHLKVKPLVALIAFPFIYYCPLWISLGLIFYWSLWAARKKLTR